VVANNQISEYQGRVNRPRISITPVCEPRVRSGSITSFRARDGRFCFALYTGRFSASQRTVESGQQETFTAPKIESVQTLCFQYWKSSWASQEFDQRIGSIQRFSPSTVPWRPLLVRVPEPKLSLALIARQYPGDRQHGRNAHY
jgi:hypothetical protein